LQREVVAAAGNDDIFALYWQRFILAVAAESDGLTRSSRLTWQK